MDDTRQRAREAAERALEPALGESYYSRRHIARAIEAYFDERMRGEAAESLGVEVLRERLTASQAEVSRLTDLWETACDLADDIRSAAETDAAALRARVAELEAVVRAADAMRKYIHAFKSLTREESARDYDAARAKVEVPGE